MFWRAFYVFVGVSITDVRQTKTPADSAGVSISRWAYCPKLTSGF